VTPTLVCTDLRKVYPGQTDYALGSPSEGVSLEVQRGELFALLGPSGCGKTTTLRIVGGFVEPTDGRVEIEGVDVTDRHPSDRPTNTVFQSYALFPHLRLSANVEYGLKMEGVARNERRKRAAEALELVGLGGMGDRRISELSGGQQQRAALARAIVKRPALLLLDEPLGALDLKLRRQMQDELVHLKRETQTTFIHVTHDQEEACAIADRIAVMDQGLIVQVDTPEALYRAPRTSYVAGFIDAGTIVRGHSRSHSDTVEVSHPDVTVRGSRPPGLGGTTTMAAVLPHDRVRLAASDETGPGMQCVPGTLDRLVFTGSLFHAHVRVSDALEVRATVPVEDLAAVGGERLAPGAPVHVTWAADDVVIVEDSAAAPAGELVGSPAAGEPN
jgi:ABC-type Fe3+/spermidine/putrescine transport system ATPase subunit